MAIYYLHELAGEELAKEWPKRKVLQDLIPDDRKVQGLEDVTSGLSLSSHQTSLGLASNPVLPVFSGLWMQYQKSAILWEGSGFALPGLRLQCCCSSSCCGVCILSRQAIMTSESYCCNFQCAQGTKAVIGSMLLTSEAADHWCHAVMLHSFSGFRVPRSIFWAVRETQGKRIIYDFKGL